MPRKQTKFPAWFDALKISASLREELAANFTIHRDGYVRWHLGKPRHVCARSVDPREVADRWDAKKRAIDAAGRGVALVAGSGVEGVLTYRQVLAKFLPVQKARVGAKRNRIEERTYFNKATELNNFGNFVFEGRKVADMDVRDVGPPVFTAYAMTFGSWKASGFDSVVSRVGELFRWAAEMDYIDRYRPGPESVRPAKKDLRHERIELVKSFTPAQVATLYLAAGPTMRLWIALGICAAFNNSDVAHLTRSVVDLDSGLIDYRRRKTGKVRRVIPLPADVAKLLRAYRRPEPTDPAYADFFFVSRHGNPFGRSASRDGSYKPSDSISTYFGKLLDATGVSTTADGRSFSGLRTTFFNLVPRGEWTLERQILMGRAQGTVDMDSYLEELGVQRLKHVVNHVWGLVKKEIKRISSERRGKGPKGGRGAKDADAVRDP